MSAAKTKAKTKSTAKAEPQKQAKADSAKKKPAAPVSVGLKRICTSCGTRFYDFNKRPIICPACNTEFTGDVKVKSRRGRLPADDSKAKKPVEDDQIVLDEDDIIDDETELEVVSLDDASIEDNDDSDDDEAIDLGEDDLAELDDFEDALDDDIEEDLIEEEDV